METKPQPVTGLPEALENAPDPRAAKGKRHPLPVILAIATAAMLCGARSIFAIAQWGRDQEPELLRGLGLRREKSPCMAAFEAALGRWAQLNLPAGRQAIAVDGKSPRGIHGEPLPGVHLVAAYTHSAGLVLGQAGSGADNKEIGLAVAPRLLARIDVKGRVVTFSSAGAGYSFSETPASAKVAISASTFVAASTSEMASAAPVPSPRRIWRSRRGFSPRRASA